MPSGHLYSGIPVNIRQQAEAEAFRVWWICESIHCQWGLRGVKRLPDALVQLIVRYRAPEGRLRVSHWLQVCRRGKTTHQLRKNHRAFLHWKKSKDQHWKVFSVYAQMCLLSYWQATTRPIQNHHLTNLLPLLWLPAKSPPYVQVLPSLRHLFASLMYANTDVLIHHAVFFNLHYTVVHREMPKNTK